MFAPTRECVRLDTNLTDPFSVLPWSTLHRVATLEMQALQRNPIATQAALGSACLCRLHQSRWPFDTLCVCTGSIPVRMACAAQQRFGQRSVATHNVLISYCGPLRACGFQQQHRAKKWDDYACDWIDQNFSGALLQMLQACLPSAARAIAQCTLTSSVHRQAHW